MKINEKVLDQLLADCENPEQIVGENGLLQQLTKAVLERALEAEMSLHLGYEEHAPAGRNSGDSRDGSTASTKRSSRLYARGRTTRAIQSHFEESYGVEVNPALISKVTDEVRRRRNRPLERLYPAVFLDALFVKMRDGGQVSNRAVYVALGVNLEGEKDVLGPWVVDTEGVKFRLGVLKRNLICDLRRPRIPALRLRDPVLQHRDQQLIHILACPNRHHPVGVDLVEHGDVRVHLVGRGERRRFQVHNRPLIRRGLGAL